MTIKQFNAIKLEKKRQLCRVIEEHEGVALDPIVYFRRTGQAPARV